MVVAMAMAMAMAASSSFSNAFLLPFRPRISASSYPSFSESFSKSFACCVAADGAADQCCTFVASPASSSAAGASSEARHMGLSRREAALAFGTGSLALAFSGAAWADIDDDYKKETQQVIQQVKNTLVLEKTDPSKPEAVALLRQASNDWVAKYRREKKVAGKPSFSNMYSVLNAISGHYISFGPSSPIPAKRQQRILEEINDAEKALTRGR
ncbi:hypothetical protein O6H91_02G142200 [Diphasiastrum complanatum]|nr:hypothetical protein O6H91_Y149400 [Diphasiastrum complanatum]KAJ7567314.1 hypothetical protein O6H91_02G142200 [Diphasiastrum complanatum]